MNEQPPQMQPRLTTEQIDFCIAHMLRVPSLFELARQNLRVSDFSTASQMRYALLWSSALQVAERNGGTLPEQGAEFCIACELTSLISSAGSEVTPETSKIVVDMLGWIFQFQESDLNPDYYRGMIQELIIEQTVLRNLNKTATQALTIGRPLDLPEQLEQVANRIREVRLLGKKTARNLREDWPDFQTRLQVYRGREFLGLRTGMSQLDERTLGLRGLILLGAMPNVGKTALVLHLGVNIVRNNPDACYLFISLEMDRSSLYTRINCNLAEMDWGTLVRGDKNLRGGGGPYFTADQQTRLQAADTWIAQNGHRIRVLDRQSFESGISAASILREMKALKQQSGASRAFVVIDYLQVIPIPDTVRRNSELDADKYQIRVAQDILAGMQQGESSLMGDAVIAISETRKPATGRKHWGEDLADLMGSARLGYGADAVLLYRRILDDEDLAKVYEDAGHSTPPTPGQLDNEGIAPIVLTLAKGRDGMRLGEWPLEYHYNRSIFREIVPEQRPALPHGRRPPLPTQPPPPAQRDPLSELENIE
jgi:replicative DNA helicase